MITGKKCKVLFPFILMGVMLSACGKLAPLPDEPIRYAVGQFCPPDEDTGYATVEYGDRVYILYGGLRGRGWLGDLTYAYGDCLGYVGEDETRLIYELSNEDSGVWLIERDGGGFMSVPIVLREIRSKGADVPASVEPFGYAYWGEISEPEE